MREAEDLSQFSDTTENSEALLAESKDIAERLQSHGVPNVYYKWKNNGLIPYTVDQSTQRIRLLTNEQRDIIEKALIEIEHLQNPLVGKPTKNNDIISKAISLCDFKIVAILSGRTNLLDYEVRLRDNVAAFTKNVHGKMPIDILLPARVLDTTSGNYDINPINTFSRKDVNNPNLFLTLFQPASRGKIYYFSNQTSD